MMPLQSLMRVFGESDAVPLDRDPIVVLGRRYDMPDGDLEWPQPFVCDAASRPWLMYRTGFARIPRDPQGPSPLMFGALLRGAAIDPFGFVSDAGWGCMIRTAQSLVATALQTLQRGRDWVRESPDIPIDPQAERRLFAPFYDTPGATLAVHSFVERGLTCGRRPGEWFGPSTAAAAIRGILSDGSAGNDCKLVVYVSDGMDVYADRLVSAATAADSGGAWSPVLVLCGLRLGIEQVNPIYYDGLRALLAAPQSVGIAGGRTSASLYFYGYQGDRLFFHDPHTVRSALQPDSDDSVLATLRSTRIWALPLSEMDPSILAGFLLLSQSDFDDWRQRMGNVQSEACLVCVQDSAPQIPDTDCDCGGESDCESVLELGQEQRQNNAGRRAEPVEVVSPKLDSQMDEPGPGAECFVLCAPANAETRTEYL